MDLPAEPPLPTATREPSVPRRPQPPPARAPPSAPPAGRARYARSSGNQQGDSSREETFKKVLVLGAGTGAAAARTAGGAHRVGGAKGRTDAGTGASGPAGGPRGAEPPGKRRRLPRKTGDPRPPNHPPGGGRGRATGAGEKGHGCPRASASLSRVRGASHLGSGARARSSVPCCRHRADHRLRPLPAGGATGQQREPVSLL